MKKILFGVIAGLILVSVISISGCKKDDTTPPSISMAGNSTMIISLNSSAVADPGATATDDEDGNVAVTSDWSWGTNPNPNVAGDYDIHYTATDAAGNQGTAHRTVTVRNDAYFLAGTYTTTEGTTSWTQTITVSASVNGQITFSKFANYSNNNSITATVTGTGVGATVSLGTTQNANGIGASSCSHTFTPQSGGATVAGSAGNYTFSIKFTDEQLSGPGCTPTLPIPYEDFFVQQ
jgi:hypothetical protein